MPTSPIIPPEDIDPITLARFLSGESDGAESNRVRRWMSSDPANAALIAGLRTAWDPASVTPVSGEVWDVEQALAHVRSGQPLNPLRHGKTTVRRWRFDRVWMVAAATCLVTIVAVATLIGRSSRSEGRAAGRSYATAAGERANVTLPDGSTLTLAPQSRLTLAPSYDRQARLVTLQGEAYFAVKHDASRPFSVQAYHTTITDVGTQFDVRHYPSDGDVRVVVAQGAVAVAADRDSSGSQPLATRLYRNDMASVGMADIAVAHNVDIAALTAWMQGALVFNATPLSDAIQDLARNYDLRITVADSGLATQRITGTFGAQSADEILDLVTRAIGARFERTGRTVVIRRRTAAARQQMPPKAAASLRLARSNETRE